MTVKESVQNVLENAPGEYFSGEDLARNLGVSRNAVWKAVSSLREEGYEIDSVPNRGYCLRHEGDRLSREKILRDAEPPALYVYDTIDSTNEEAKRLLTKGAGHGTLVAANRQTAGKGRRGRTFYSPSDTGVYFSVILKPGLEFSESVLITTAASVAVCRAIESVCGVSCGIKWVNDVYIGEHKICGILTEAVTDVESGTIGSIICGIGINVETTQFPGEVSEIASSIYTDGKTHPVRNRLVAAAYSELMRICDTLPDRTFLKEYRRRSIVIGRKIRYTDHGEWKDAQAVGIDESGGLIVDTPMGRRTLHSGEITIRWR